MYFPIITVQPRTTDYTQVDAVTGEKINDLPKATAEGLIGTITRRASLVIGPEYKVWAKTEWHPKSAAYIWRQE